MILPLQVQDKQVRTRSCTVLIPRAYPPMHWNDSSISSRLEAHRNGRYAQARTAATSTIDALIVGVLIGLATVRPTGSVALRDS
jgi:hypothetical protein